MINPQPKIAYFCMEYGLDNKLPIYAGGLGILAGDYLKAAADLDAPVAGIGLLWRQDYTEQLIGEDGRPYDVYPSYDYAFVKDTGLTVTVKVRGADVVCKIRLVDQFNNAPLYLLDTNFPGSDHGWMTSKLYGGVEQDRIAAEMLLGIGGVRALRTLGIETDIYHFNEGHAVFAGLELIREKMEQGMAFTEAWEATRRQIVFTTHTPVEAGNESHDFGILQHMSTLMDFTNDQLQQIGGNPFSMTVAGLRLSNITNAVSAQHSKTAQNMWQHVDNAAPIIDVTNGVHAATWQDNRIRSAYKNAGDLWQPHLEAKQDLIDYIKSETNSQLALETLTIGFARRAAPYKRSELIFRDTEKIDRLLQDGKLQLVFSGKAHPNDTLGKDIIQRLVQMDRKYGKQVIFLENYDMEIAKLLTSGCDVWLNNPRRPLEASGTSGMKAAMNGVLNISVVDGWIAEGAKHKVNAWLLDEVFDTAPDSNQDEYDLRALYHVLYDEVIPIYYDDHQRWVNMMRASIDMSQYDFSAQRMLKDYYEKMYLASKRENSLTSSSIYVKA